MTVANPRVLGFLFMRRRAEKLSYHKYKVLRVPPQNGRGRAAPGSGHEAPLSMYPLATFSSLGPYSHTLRAILSDTPFCKRPLSTYPSVKKDDVFHFKLVLKCFCTFWWPCTYTLSGLRSAQDRICLVMHPLIAFP